MLIQFPYGSHYQVGVIISSPKHHLMVGDLIEVWVNGEIKKIRTQDLELHSPHEEKLNE